MSQNNTLKRSSQEMRKSPARKNTNSFRSVLLALLVLAVVGGGVYLYTRLTRPDYSDVPRPNVTITMESGDEIHLELYPDVAPNTVANFVSLAEKGFYDGVIFHRVIAGFMIQGGDPTGTGMGGPGYSIKGEFSANGVRNDLKHTRGVISMARSQANDSAGSQFFIMHMDASSLNGQYAAFGRVTDDESQAVVDKIATTKTDSSDRPLSEWRIRSVTVDTHGVTYAPVTIQ